MNNQDQFSITIGDSISREHDEAADPQDPLGELTDFEMGLWRYCYQNNRRILITVGDRSLVIELDLDVSIIFDELKDAIARLSSMQDAKISFYELSATIHLTIEAESVRCVLECYGYVWTRPHHRLLVWEEINLLGDIRK